MSGKSFRSVSKFTIETTKGRRKAPLSFCLVLYQKRTRKHCNIAGKKIINLFG
jgi:hypothetical protein